jgi:lysophospholipase L1-like esterase
MAQKFDGAEKRCAGLAEAYARVAADLDCHFFDAGTVASVSSVDGVHLDADQHPRLGDALCAVVLGILRA